MRSLILVADGGRPAGSPLSHPEFLYGTLGLAGALLVGAAVVYAVDRWRKRAALQDQSQDGTELTSFRIMYERGEITEAEYAILRQKVAARVKAPPPAGSNTAIPTSGDGVTPKPTTGPVGPGSFPAAAPDDSPEAGPRTNSPQGPPGPSPPPL